MFNKVTQNLNLILDPEKYAENFLRSKIVRTTAYTTSHIIIIPIITVLIAVVIITRPQQKLQKNANTRAKGLNRLDHVIELARESVNTP